MGPEGSKEDQELTHKTVGPGETDGRKGDNQKEGRKPGLHRGDASKIRNHAGMAALINHSDQKKEGPCADSVIDDLKIGPLYGLRGEGKETQHDKT